MSRTALSLTYPPKPFIYRVFVLSWDALSDASPLFKPFLVSEGTTLVPASTAKALLEPAS